MNQSDNPNEIDNSADLIDNTYGGQTVRMPNGKDYDKNGKSNGKQAKPIDGKSSLMNTINVLHYNSPSSVDLTESLFTNEETHFVGNTPKGYKNPTGSKILEEFGEANRTDQGGHNMRYQPGDFLFLDKYGKMPNNYLLTLRRFPSPCGDNILNEVEAPLPDTARLLAYMDEEDNKMESIFGFSAGMNWKEFKSEIQTQQNAKNGWGKLDAWGPVLDPKRTQREALQGQAATDFDPYEAHQNNYTWGPIDVIDTIMTRERGLKFDHDIKIKFKYAVRSYNGISTKAAFLDILGNVLNMTTNKAPFWGGAVRFTGGGGHSGPLGDSTKLRNGDLGGFLESFGSDLKKKLSKTFEKGIVQGVKDILSAGLAKMIGGKLDDLGRPEKFGIYSLLSGTPTGEWHLTVGNPFNPAMMVGNLILDSSTMSFEGPFTADDVPSYVIVEVTMKPAMPRDKYAIQSMFNRGKGRYYGSDTDFQAKSYYRNRAGMASSTTPQKSENIINNSANTASKYGNATAKYAKSAYSSA